MNDTSLLETVFCIIVLVAIVVATVVSIMYFREHRKFRKNHPDWVEEQEDWDDILGIKNKDKNDL